MFKCVMLFMNSIKIYNFWLINGDEFIVVVIVLGKYVYKFMGILIFFLNFVLK